MAPKYTLTYFNIRGRGEFARLVFVAAGQEYVDKRIEFPDWADLKPKTPQGSMPILEVAGGPTLVQSFAIARYLAREFKLYGKTNNDMAVVDQIIDNGAELIDAYIPIVFNKDEEEKAEKMKAFRENNLVNFLKYTEALVKQTGKKGFAVGDSLTLADIVISGTLDMLKPEASLEGYSGLAENKKTFEGLPKIKEYLAKRA